MVIIEGFTIAVASVLAIFHAWSNSGLMFASSMMWGVARWRNLSVTGVFIYALGGTFGGRLVWRHLEVWGELRLTELQKQIVDSNFLASDRIKLLISLIPLIIFTLSLIFHAIALIPFMTGGGGSSNNILMEAGDNVSWVRRTIYMLNFYHVPIFGSQFIIIPAFCFSLIACFKYAANVPFSFNLINPLMLLVFINFIVIVIAVPIALSLQILINRAFSPEVKDPLKSVLLLLPVLQPIIPSAHLSVLFVSVYIEKASSRLFFSFLTFSVSYVAIYYYCQYLSENRIKRTVFQRLPPHLLEYVSESSGIRNATSSASLPSFRIGHAANNQSERFSMHHINPIPRKISLTEDSQKTGNYQKDQLKLISKTLPTCTTVDQDIDISVNSSSKSYLEASPKTLKSLPQIASEELNRARGEEALSFVLLVSSFFTGLAHGASDIGLLVGFYRLCLPAIRIDEDSAKNVASWWVPLLFACVGSIGIVLGGRRQGVVLGKYLYVQQVALVTPTKLVDYDEPVFAKKSENLDQSNTISNMSSDSSNFRGVFNIGDQACLAPSLAIPIEIACSLVTLGALYFSIVISPFLVRIPITLLLLPRSYRTVPPILNRQLVRRILVSGFIVVPLLVAAFSVIFGISLMALFLYR